jgi:hypothetical protein
MKWTMAKGWLSTNSTLNQICFGVETVSTGDADATFRVSAFSINTKLRPGLDRATSPSDPTNSTPASKPRGDKAPKTK